MNLKQELRDLAAEGSDASISLMRDLVMQNPQHAKMAFELWAENGSETATDSIFILMKEYPGSLGLDGIDALGEAGDDNALVNIYNFIGMVDMEDRVRSMALFHALDVLHDSENSNANEFASRIMEMDPVIPAIRVSILLERAQDGDESAVDAMCDLAMLSPHTVNDVYDALIELDTEYAKDTFEKLQKAMKSLDEIDEDDVDLNFLSDFGIDPPPSDDDTPSDGLNL